MGTWRFILSLLVVWSHLGGQVAGLNPGVVAVVMFYMISGYVMSALISTYYALPQRWPAFVLDRLLRLMPQYIFYLILSLIIWWTLRPSSYFLSAEPDAAALLANLAVVPLNFYMFSGVDRFTLIPPAWSLGLEWQFYLLAPILIRWPRVAVAAAAGSVAVQICAWVNVINTDWYGYRLLPGTLCFFLWGMALRHCEVRGLLQRPPVRRSVLLLPAGLSTVAFLSLGATPYLTLPYTREVLVGWGVGSTVLFFLIRSNEARVSALLGSLSYGVFLSHFLILFIQSSTKLGFLSGKIDFTVILLFSIAMSIVSFYAIEKPTFRFRRRKKSV